MADDLPEKLQKALRHVLDEALAESSVDLRRELGLDLRQFLQDFATAGAVVPQRSRLTPSSSVGGLADFDIPGVVAGDACPEPPAEPPLNFFAGRTVTVSCASLEEAAAPPVPRRNSVPGATRLLALPTGATRAFVCDAAGASHAFDSEGSAGGDGKPQGSLSQQELAFAKTKSNNSAILWTSFWAKSRCEKLTQEASLLLSLQEKHRGWLWDRASVVVQSSWFSCAIGLLVVLNGIFVGIKTHLSATNLEVDDEPSLRPVGTFFTICFLMELLLKLFVWRWNFFTMESWPWNVMDLAVVLMQAIEEFGSLDQENWQSSSSRRAGVLRLLRGLRLIRVVRLLRIVRAITDLRVLVGSLMRAVRQLIWVAALFVLLIYTMSIYVTQLVADHRREHLQGGTELRGPSAARFYGSLPSTMMCLFQAITGGAEWDKLLEPLQEMYEWMAFVFIAYIAFACLALLNVVTGVFVESVMRCNRMDKDVFLMNNAKELFQHLPGGLSSQMDWEQFQEQVDRPQMQEFFRAIDVDPSEAERIFVLLDVNDSGTVSGKEFLNGCVRLRGTARAIHLAQLTRQVHLIARHLRIPDMSADMDFVGGVA